ncbi:hypothetical protein ACTDI4_17070 [Mesorhizobium sp. PUT5]|uniref:hypothetical protein n=1 Tax=Mesorhizobium sp. PUT5 TaxID=3454629 RepID=UPI003FA43EFC
MTPEHKALVDAKADILEWMASFPNADRKESQAVIKQIDAAIESLSASPAAQVEAVAWQNIDTPSSILTPEQYGMRLPLAEGGFRPLYASPQPANPAQVTEASEGQYRKKPVVIEAFQMTEAHRMDNSDWPNWLHRAWNGARNEAGTLQRVDMDAPLPDLLQIVTLEGLHLVSWGDWIIQGVKGELYPCKPDIFEATYEPALAIAPAPAVTDAAAADWQRIDDALVSCASLIRALAKDDIAAVAAAELDYVRSALAANHMPVGGGYVLVPREIIDRFPEINPSNYTHDDACELNSWGVEVVLAAARAGRDGE